MSRNPPTGASEPGLGAPASPCPEPVNDSTSDGCNVAERLQRIVDGRGPRMIPPTELGPEANWIVSTAICGDYFERRRNGFVALWSNVPSATVWGIAVAVEDLFVAGQPRLNGSWQKLLAVAALSRVNSNDQSGVRSSAPMCSSVL